MAVKSDVLKQVETLIDADEASHKPLDREKMRKQSKESYVKNREKRLLLSRSRNNGFGNDTNAYLAHMKWTHEDFLRLVRPYKCRDSVITETEFHYPEKI